MLDGYASVLFPSPVSTTRATGVFLAVFWTVCATAANWPQFRGPDACGVDATAPTPVHWNVEKGENIRWRAHIPGLAHSSPIIWENIIYVSTAIGPGDQDVKVGLYGDIGSANDQDSHEWHLGAIKTVGQREGV